MSGKRHALDIRHMAAACVIADLRSYRLAAGQLNTTQPTLSRLIHQAEAALGTTLFRRGWSGTDLTTQGEDIIRRFRAVVALLDEAEAAMFPAPGPHPTLRHSLRLRQLDVIGAVVRTRSASGAAPSLGGGQPDVSRSLSQSARHLGLALFRRSRDGLVPLDAAERLARLGSRIRYEIAQIPRDLAEHGTDIHGRVAVGMLPFSGQALIARAFAALTNSHPRLRLSCVPGSYNSLVEALRRSEIDRIVGILRGPACALDLCETPLYDERFTIIARHDHPLGRARSLGKLAGTNWVVAPHGTPVRSYFERLFDGIGAAPPIQTCEMLSFTSTEQMLAESNSVGMLTYGARQLAQLRPDLRRVPIDLPGATVPSGLTGLRNATPPPAVAAFQAELVRLAR